MTQARSSSMLLHTATESGAYPQEAMEALVRYFGYSDEVRWGGGDDNMLRNEIDAGRPVFYVGHKYFDIGNFNSGSNSPTSSRDSHAFVCDGYADQGFFHFNLGWGGYYNGWYRSNVIMLGNGDDYSLWMGSMLKLQPSNKTRFEKNNCLYEIVDENNARLITVFETDVLTISAQVEWEGKTYDLSKTFDKGPFVNLEGVKQVVIEEGITNLAPYAFSGSKIETISLPSTLTYIDKYAFLNCNNLESITIRPQTIVGPNAFNSCKGLKNIIIEDGVTSIATRHLSIVVWSNCACPKALRLVSIRSLPASNSSKLRI